MGINVLCTVVECCCLKKNETTPRPSEHPPVMGEKMLKRLGVVVVVFFIYTGTH